MYVFKYVVPLLRFSIVMKLTMLTAAVSFQKLIAVTEAYAQNLSDRQLSPPSIFLNSEVSTSRVL